MHLIGSEMFLSIAGPRILFQFFLKNVLLHCFYEETIENTILPRKCELCLNTVYKKVFNETKPDEKWHTTSF